MSTDVRRGINAMLGVGVVLTAGTVLAGVVIGPRTPGAGAEALVNWRGDRNGPGSRTTVSPFVEIKKRLVDQSLVELFRVQSDQRAYWRLTALDQFDGNLWSSNGSYERASSSLPTDVDSNAPKTVVTQSFTIKSLSTIWVPAAFEPKRLDAKGTSVRYEPASSTLIVGTDLASSDGTTYTVQSAQPVFQPNELASAPPDIPNDIRTRDLALPNMSSTAAELAKQITAGLGSSFDKARALQDYFRNNFEYSLDVPQGESTSAIDAFLASKSGYCEQFAGAYAAMARSVGLPARVAVGFTPGEELTPGTFVVRGEHAHAWPEVYIQGQGWVLFEPTPTRGAPNAQQYTGVPEQQSTGGGVGVTTLVPTTQVTTPNSGPASATPTTNPQERDPLGGLTSPSSKSFWATWWPRAAIGLLVVVLLLAVYAAAVPTLHAMRRRQRRANAVEPTDRVRVAWDESVEAVSLLGLQPKHSETPAEFAARTDPVLDGEMVSTLATSLEAADYSATGVDEAEALQATALAAGIEEAVRERTTPQQRARALLDPRSSDRRRTRRSSRRGPVTRGDAPPIEMLKPR
jgi:transglutaminase-like putative cysteine protease